jgi:hypothetical protein
MFCPKCAANLVEEDGELKCPTGKMGFSRVIGRALLDRYGDHVPSANRGIASITPGIVRAAGSSWIAKGDVRLAVFRCGSLRTLYRQSIGLKG